MKESPRARKSLPNVKIINSAASCHAHKAIAAATFVLVCARGARLCFAGCEISYPVRLVGVGGMGEERELNRSYPDDDVVVVCVWCVYMKGLPGLPV